MSLVVLGLSYCSKTHQPLADSDIMCELPYCYSASFAVCYRTCIPDMFSVSISAHHGGKHDSEHESGSLRPRITCHISVPVCWLSNAPETL